ncbi:MAG: DUF5719 family protein [Actinomycetota bacterium]|nr:DUF5719 family protein [Actinomycetota bacterium]
MKVFRRFRRTSLLSLVLCASLLALLSFSPASAAGTWSPQREDLIESHFEDIFFLPGGVEGWAVGQPQQSLDGTTFYDCWHTTDGGTTWTGQRVGDDPFLHLLTIRGVYFRSPNLGYAVGDSGLISKCTDSTGVGTWNIVYMGETTNVFFDVFAPSDTEAIVVGANMLDLEKPSTWSPIVMKTVDGGASWSSMALLDVSFADSNNGWAVGDGGVIIATNDGGTTWSLQASGTTKRLNSVFAISQDEAWVGGKDGTILHTVDGGTTWSSDFGANAVFSLDSTHTWIAGQRGLILFYDGSSWTVQNSTTTSNLNGIHFINANYGWAVGENNVNLYTTDGGSNWNAGPALAANLNDVFVYNDSGGSGNYLVWACGDGGALFYTTDAPPGGTPAAWSTPVGPPPAQDLLGVEFESAASGYVAGLSGTLAYTSNGGANWTNASGVGTTNFTDVSFSKTTGIWFATAWDGGIWQTRNGTTWGPFDIYDVAKPDADIEYYVGGGGAIIKRDGNTWKAQDSGTPENLRAVEVGGDGTNYVFAVGQNGAAVWTNDGGATVWNPVADGAFSNRDVSIVEDSGSPGTYYITWVGDGGHIRQATHIPATATWTDRNPASTPGATNLLSVDFLNKDVGWAVGEGGTVWQTLDGSSATPHWSLVDLEDVFSLPDGTAYWVGSGGTIIHYDGTNYSIEFNTTAWTSEKLNSVYFVDSNNGYVVGENGITIQYLSGWQAPAQVGAPTPDLNSVYLSDATNGYAVGANGYYVQLLAGAWQAPAQVGAPTPDLNSVYLSDAANGYAVGANGYYVQLLAGVWQAPAQVGPPTPNLYDLDLVSGNGFAVGGSGTEGYRVPITGGSFGSPVSMDSGTRDLTGISFSSASLAFASGMNRTMWKYDSTGPGWTKISSLEGTDNLNGIDFDTASKYGWVVGNSGIVYLARNGLFTKENSSTTKNLESVSAVSSNNAFACGQDGTIVGRDGTWSVITSPTSNNLYGIDFTDASAGVIAGESRLMAWTNSGGSSWALYSGVQKTTNDFLALDFTDSSNGWICGQAGMLYRYLNGTVGPQTSGTSLELRGISMYSGPAGFAVGDGRLVISTSDGSTWNTLSVLQATNTIYDISFPTAIEGWFCGSSGFILHYNVAFQTQTSGTTEDLYGISLCNNGSNDTGSTVGSNGVVRFTNNNGANWNASSSGHTDDLFGVDIVSLTQGIACGENGRVIRSTNGGQNWADPAAPPSTANNLRGVEFGDSTNNYAWVVGDGGKVYGGTNNGDNWAEQTSQTNNRLNAVSALHDGVNYQCWAVGEVRTIIRSTDGNTWNTISEIPSPSALFASDFVDSSNFYAVGFEVGFEDSSRGIICHTTNGGITFNQELAAGIPPLYGIDAYDSNNVWAAGDSGTVLCWDGVTWNPQGAVPGTVNLRDISIDYNGAIPNFEGVTVGSDGNIYYTSDGGANWDAGSSFNRNDLRASWFESAFSRAFSSGDYGTIIGSTNKGANWNFLQGPANNLNGMSFADANNGIACGEKGVVLYTTDAGATWMPSDSVTDKNLNDVSMYLDGGVYRGIAVGDNATVRRTSNGGQTWSPATSPPVSNNLSSVDFIDSTHAWAVGDNGHIWISADSGDTWTEQESNPTANLRAVDFFDEECGVAVGGTAGSTESVRWTDDGGATWQTPANPPAGSVKINDVSMGGKSDVWAVGEGGSIWYSDDGGDNWVFQEGPVSDELFGVSFGAPGHSDTRNGLIVGASPAVTEPACALYTSNGGGTWGEIESATGVNRSLMGISSIWDTDRIKAYSCGSFGRIQVCSQSLAAPVITPPLVPGNGVTGTEVTINGSSFGAGQPSVNGHVYFGGETEASINTWTGTEIKAVVPNNAITGNVHVVHDGGSSNGVTFTVLPNITNVSPTQMSYGTAVTITGTGFGNDPGSGNRSTDTNNVKVNGGQIPDGSFTSWTRTEIKFTLPPDIEPGIGVPVTVTAGGKESAPPLNVNVIPKIEKLSPDSGKTGDEIEINGGNFGTSPLPYDPNNCVKMQKMDEDGNVSLEMVPEAFMVSWNNTNIKFKIPDDPAVFQPWTGPVRVLRNSSASTQDPVLSITPWISGTSTTTAKVGDSVTIDGSGFGEVQGANGKVYFNNVDSGTASTWGYNRIVVNVPENATSGQLKVQTLYGESNLIPFNVTPVIDWLSSSEGRVGDSVTINGTGFGASKGSNTVKFNGEPAQVEGWTSTKITVSVPAKATSGSVIVTVNDVESNQKSFKVLPKITSISPSSGIPGTTIVTINGFTFGETQGSSKVTFAGVDAGKAKSWSKTKIETRVPAAVTSGGVIVTTPSGQSNSVQFTAGPYISSVSPLNGPAGISVTVSGKNFGDEQGTSKVRFANVDAIDVESWSDSSVRAKVPMGAKTGNVTITTPVGTSNGIQFSVTLPKTFYFAEGTTRQGFQEFICLMNPNDTAASVTITYMLSEGPNQTHELEVSAKSRLTVRVEDVVGKEKDVSARVDSDKQIVAERPMYFNYNGVWTGGHDVMGAVGASKEWYFAEGNTRDEFEEWICLQNPSEHEAAVEIKYMLTGGGTRAQGVKVPAKSRRTISAKQFLGPGVDCAAKVTSDVGIVAERPMYFNYKNMWTGGHDCMGATSPSETWYFAEGTTRSGFDEWICLLNPGTYVADVKITYMLETGETKAQSLSVLGTSRVTVDVHGAVEREHDVSARITSSQPIIAERPIYFDYVGITGGHDVIGANSTASQWYFAEGTTMQGFQEWLSIQNPGDKEAEVRITYMLTGGENKEQKLAVPGHARVTVDVNGSIGWGKDAGAKVVALGEDNKGIIVERPMYFDFYGWTGGHDVIGFPLW